MPLSDWARIAAEQKHPRIVALWRALTVLKSTVSFMNTGAHPDDETSAMLAAMRFRDGVDISYACSTRGEGGQNDIGTESAAALGTLRTAEMEAACDQLDLRMYWLSVSPEDTIFDFGFSKSGVETLNTWGRERTLARFVQVIRTERPDIICPTFLDVPGQHGHHRAMTEAAHEVMALAADPDFAQGDLPAWQVKKLYLPAWSGAGQAYDDDLPPPPATITVEAKGKDPVTGWSFEHIGQHSRVLHATQAMGRWVAAGTERDFPLHLAESHVPGPDHDLSSGLATTLRDLPGFAATQDACDAAVDAFPSAPDVLRHACAALNLLRENKEQCPPDVLAENHHKLARKDAQLSRVIHLATVVDGAAFLRDDVLRAGDRTGMVSEITTDHGTLTLTPRLPPGWSLSGADMTLDADAGISDPYPPIYLPGQPDAPCLDVTLTLNGVSATVARAFEVPPLVLPNRSAAITPEADVLNLGSVRRSVAITISDVSPASAEPGLHVPEGWRCVRSEGRFTVTVPDDVAPGLYDLTLTLDGDPASSVRPIRRDHIAPRVLVRPAVAQLRIVDVALPDVRVGYIGGGNDRVGAWLDRMGLSVTDLSEVALSEAALATCDTLVIGIFAMKFRPGLAEAMPRIHDWCRAGGTLVTLYHRPWDNWKPETTAPFRLEIGQPSLRWRVTDETAEVTALVPDHPVLNDPNMIGEADWAGWHKERGLYFAKDWDAAYTPVLRMQDPEETPLDGAVLVADVGQGRHIHTSLILHHQMEHLTPGAFRLMANLLVKRG